MPPHHWRDLSVLLLGKGYQVLAYNSHPDLYHSGFLDFLLPTEVFCAVDHCPGHTVPRAETRTLTLSPFSKIELSEEFLQHFLIDMKQFLHFCFEKVHFQKVNIPLPQRLFSPLFFTYLTSVFDCFVNA